MLTPILIVTNVLLFVYAVAMTARAIRARRLCKCGAQAGSFTQLTDTTLHIFERPMRTHATRWDDNTLAQLQPEPAILRDDEI